MESGGEYLAAGVGQAIHGFRADLFVVDDPIRSREDAASDIVRRSTWEWYLADAKSRQKPGGRIVLISTLAEMEKGRDLWETLILPAIAEENDPLGQFIGGCVASSRRRVVAAARGDGIVARGEDLYMPRRLLAGLEPFDLEIVAGLRRRPLLIHCRPQEAGIVVGGIVGPQEFTSPARNGPQPIKDSSITR